MNEPEDLLEKTEEERFEQALMRALRRVDAPAGFAERTIARTKAGALQDARPRARVITMQPRGRAWISGAIAAAVLVGVFAAEQVHLRDQREQAEAAQRQFEAGIRITDTALEHTRLQLERAGILVGNQ